MSLQVGSGGITKWDSVWPISSSSEWTTSQICKRIKQILNKISGLLVKYAFPTLLHSAP